MQIDDERRITRFVEKPKDPAVQDSLKLPQEWYPQIGHQGRAANCSSPRWAFTFSTASAAASCSTTLSPISASTSSRSAIKTHRVFSYVFQGYWEDIGTIRSFFEANLDLTSELPRFNFFDMSAPIFTRPRFLPGSKINGAQIDHAIISDGCIINHAHINHSIVGIRSLVGAGTELNRVIHAGLRLLRIRRSPSKHNEKAGRPRIGIGANCRIENAIIDKNARIGNNVIISPAGKPENVDHALYFIRDGIVIIPKNGIIPHGTVI